MHDGKSPAHVQQRWALKAAEIEKQASGDKKSQKHLPAFLFNDDLAKIQSNGKNIEQDANRNFFYERNIIVEPTVPAEKLRADKEHRFKGDNSKGISKEKLFGMSLKR